ncbi:hypothetical protein H920_04438 [Fukomys damarensis]|uniref:Uncharacterized protein n=1 Tax=Fukomys damarensis TaxID=885580 RepID=A0A091DSQ1_FUKDA|nr:hypothetical protein H920_04438 [Fukomys damarensis]
MAQAQGYREAKSMEIMREWQQWGGEQQKVLVEEHSIEEEEVREEEVSSDVIKSTMEKWNECQNFFEKHNPRITVMDSVESDE